METPREFLPAHLQLSAEEAACVRAHAQMTWIKKGDFLIRQGTSHQPSGFLVEGLMRYFCWDKEGNDPTGYFVEEGTYLLDPYSFHGDGPAQLSLEALTDCEVAVISRESHRRLVRAFPRWESLSQQMVTETAIRFTEQRSLIQMDAAERYATLLERHPGVVRRSPLKHIASFLGMTQQSLSRIRKGKG